MLVLPLILRGNGGIARASSVTSVASAQTQRAPDTTVFIRAAGAALEFVPARLAIKQGTRVRFRFVNDGLLPHNIVFPKTEADMDELAGAAGGADATGYVPVDMKERMFGYSGLAKPTESVDVIMTVPPPGEYWYVCLYPGHAANMLGTLRSLR